MKLLFRISAVIILSILFSKLSFADSYSGTAYNSDTGEYEYHDIDSNNGDGSFETYNWQTGENSTIELD